MFVSFGFVGFWGGGFSVGIFCFWVLWKMIGFICGEILECVLFFFVILVRRDVCVGVLFFYFNWF